MLLWAVFDKDGRYVQNFYANDYNSSFEAEDKAYDLAEKINGQVVVCWEKEEEY